MFIQYLYLAFSFLQICFLIFFYWIKKNILVNTTMFDFNSLKKLSFNFLVEIKNKY